MTEVVKQVPTSGEALYRFRPLETFAAENGSEYVKGMLYTVREGNDYLHQLVQTWTSNNKVEVI